MKEKTALQKAFGLFEFGYFGLFCVFSAARLRIVDGRGKTVQLTPYFKA
jgi:hypothetical protein